MQKRSSKELKKLAKGASSKSKKNTQIQNTFEQIINIEKGLRNALLVTLNKKVSETNNQKELISKALNKLNAFGAKLTPILKFKINTQKYLNTVKADTERIVLLSHIRIDDENVEIPESCEHIQIIIGERTISLATWAMLLNASVRSATHMDSITPSFDFLLALNQEEHGLKIVELTEDNKNHTTIMFHKDDIISYWSRKLDPTIMSIYINTIYLESMIEDNANDGYLNIGIALQLESVLKRHKVDVYTKKDYRDFIQVTIKQLQDLNNTEDENDNEEHAKTIASIKEKITEYRNRIDELSKNEKARQKDNTEKEKHIRKLKTQLNNVEQSNTNNLALLKKARIDNHQAMTTIKKQSTSINELKTKLTQANNDNLHQELNDLRTENYTQKIKIENLNAKLKEKPVVTQTVNRKRSSYNLTKLNNLSFDI